MTVESDKADMDVEAFDEGITILIKIKLFHLISPIKKNIFIYIHMCCYLLFC